MSTRYVWNKYSVSTSYQREQTETDYSVRTVGTQRSGTRTYILLMKSAPTVYNSATWTYTGTYRLVDDGNIGSSDGKLADITTWPYAAFVFSGYDGWDLTDGGMPNYPSASNTYSGTIRFSDFGYGTLSPTTEVYHTTLNGQYSGYWTFSVSSSTIKMGVDENPTGRPSNNTLYPITVYDIGVKYSQGSTSYGQVTSADSGAHPTNGRSGSYWYRSQGSDTIDPAAVTLPASIFGGDTITASITPSSGKTYGGTVSYTYQYRLDGGAWQNIATTTATSQTLTVPKGTNTVEVQARAQDDLGFTSSTWVSSGAVSVTNNQAPTAPGTIQVVGALAGNPVTVTLTPATDPDGSVSEYIIERQIDGGDWTEVQRSAALAFTETVQSAWTTVAYRAAAVDNEGAQGPYITSETFQIQLGAVTITGPEADQGTHSGPFDIALTLGATDSPQTPEVQFSVALDGVEAINTAHEIGDQITLRLDPRAMARGAHVLKVTATKEDYMAAAQSYTYSIPDWDGSDIEGGWSGVIQDPTGRKLLPKTLAQDCLGPGGKDMATLITEVQQLLGQISPAEDVIRQAPPSGSFELAPGTLYDFTQAAATTLTFTLGAAEDGKAAAYHVRFQTGITPPALTLPDSVRKPAGFELAAGRIYDMTIVEGLLTAQSWVLFDKTVLVSNVDASSGGNTFNKSTGFTAAADSVLILYMDFTFTGNNGDGSTYNNNTLCVGRNPDAWNDTTCRLYMGSEPSGQGHGEQVLLVGFDDAGQRYFDAPGGTIKRNHAVMRISYTDGTMDFWLNGQEIAKGFGAYASGGKNSCLGAISIANTEGSHRFYGTYHEISRLEGSFTDDQLKAFTA